MCGRHEESDTKDGSYSMFWTGRCSVGNRAAAIRDNRHFRLASATALGGILAVIGLLFGARALAAEDGEFFEQRIRPVARRALLRVPQRASQDPAK